MYCDLATIIDGKIQLLVEVKAIGLDLKENHVKQIVDYAANKGLEWVILTNGHVWRVYKVTFSKPIDQELVLEFDFFNLDHKKADDLELIYVLTKEGWLKQVLGELHQKRQILNKFVIAAVCQSEPVIDVIRRELRRFAPDVKIHPEQIAQVLLTEVLKREVVEGDKAEEAQKKLSRCANKMLRIRAEKEGDSCSEDLATGQPTAPIQFPSQPVQKAGI